MSELKLQSKCYQDFWNANPSKRGLLYMNYNNAKNREHGAILKAMGMVAGVADMTYLTKRGAVFIEFKFADGKQAPAQKEWEEKVKALGYEYHVVRTEDQFWEVMQWVDSEVVRPDDLRNSQNPTHTTDVNKG
jgi:hypothetical protein